MDTKLFSPIIFDNIELKNRIVMSPMCMYSCHDQDGRVTPFHITHYESRAVGQAGLVILEASAVQPEGRISYEDLGIWSDEQIDGLQQVTSRIHAHGAKAAIQLAHAGRKANLSETIHAPSPLPFNEQLPEPKEMAQDDIKNTISAFRDAARRASEANFDIIEIHAAHGYLINQFLSPLTNTRDDQYGGDLHNRMRFLLEIIEAVQQTWNGPIFVRLSTAEYHEEGNQLSDIIDISEVLKQKGISLIDCSSGGVVPARIKPYPGYQLPMADQIRNQAEISTGAVGLITTGIQSEEILQNNRADLIFIGRQMLLNPYWAKQAALELNETIDSPKQYERGWQ
ncbi:NADPH dehydrogenase NamA [Alkalibacillus sp. S2W]|uniref:NADPH dehydrogenase NamA n=1 Tax=Alkalibacillus sp. S2W TaxID=3386553 RepID=UPI00398D37CF